MIILGLDTSGPACSAAVSKDGAVLQEIVMNTALTHSETLMPAVERVMEGAGIGMSDIDLISVIAGPGSFTGVRIGVCAARALAHAAGKKVVKVNALHALAIGAPFARGIVCPILDARRQQVYCAAFRYENGEMPVRILDDNALALTEYLAALPGDEELYFTGDGVSVHENAIRGIIGERAHFAPMHARILRASSACTIAEKNAEEAMGANLLTPIYLRLPQAERERNERITRRRV